MVRSVLPSHGVPGLEGAAHLRPCFRFDGVDTRTLTLLRDMAGEGTQIPDIRIWAMDMAGEGEILGFCRVNLGWPSSIGRGIKVRYSAWEAAER